MSIYYTSVALFEEIKGRKTLACGTVWCNRVGLPKKRCYLKEKEVARRTAFFSHNSGIKYIVFPGFLVYRHELISFSRCGSSRKVVFYNFEVFWYLYGGKIGYNGIPLLPLGGPDGSIGNSIFTGLSNTTLLHTARYWQYCITWYDIAALVTI